MELRKEQIKHINTSLCENGIKYWDLRIEMIDHIVSDLEKNAITTNFNNELTNSLKRIGWFGNLSHINTEGWQNVNKKYRKEYHNEFVSFFKNFKNTLILLVFIGMLYVVSEYLSFKLFKNLSLMLLIIPAIPFFFLTTKQLFKKFGKSVHLDYGIFYFSFAILMVGLPVQFLKDASETNQIIVLLICIPFYFIATYAGYKIYKRAISKIETMRKELLS
jgi:hypothetical protein